MIGLMVTDNLSAVKSRNRSSGMWALLITGVWVSDRNVNVKTIYCNSYFSNLTIQCSSHRSITFENTEDMNDCLKEQKIKN